MKKSSGLYLSIIFSIALILLFAVFSFAQDSIKIPDIIGNINNPYILPIGNEPGFWFSAAIGLVAGLLSSSIGAGGGLIVVPALMSTGISGIYAIGSEIFRLFIFSTIQSIRMAINRRINYTLSACLTAGTVAGGLAGYSLNKTAFFADPAGSDVFISSMIILWLIVYSFIIIPEFRQAAHEFALDQLRSKKEKQEKESAINISGETSAEENNDNSLKNRKENGSAEAETENAPQLEDELYPDEEPWPIARTIRTMKFPPYIAFPGTIKNDEEALEPAIIRRDGTDIESKDSKRYERIPIIPAVLLSMAGGFFMALTGSGGVILSFTILTKGFGCVAALVAGTDLARLALASGTLTMSTYGLNGFINIYCITGLVFGTSFGLHFGSKALKHVQTYRVKGLVSLLVISVIVNRLLSLPYQLTRSGASIPTDLAATLDQSGTWILVIGAATFCGWFMYAFATGIRQSLIPPEKRKKEKEGGK